MLMSSVIFAVKRLLRQVEFHLSYLLLQVLLRSQDGTSFFDGGDGGAVMAAP